MIPVVLGGLLAALVAVAVPVARPWLAVALVSVVSVLLLSFLFARFRGIGVLVVAPVVGVAIYEGVMLWRHQNRWL
jgi:4-hydroxybenzoate polyprenyltransferase